jgi:hypothetical protein
MTENFEYKKDCKCCGNAFFSQKKTAKYCSETCAKRDYRAKQKADKRQAKGDEIKEHNRQKLLSQEFCHSQMPPLCSVFPAPLFTKS